MDKFLIEGKGKFYWVIANDPYLSTPNNQVFRKRIHERTEKLTKALGAGGEPGTIQERAQRSWTSSTRTPTPSSWWSRTST